MGYGELQGKTFRGRYLKPDGISYGTLPEKFSTQGKAKKAADAEESKIRSGTWIDPAGPRTLARVWWKRYRSSLNLAPNSLESYDQHWRKHHEPRWGHMPLGEIKAIDLDIFENDLRAKGLKESSIVVIMAPLRGMLNAAATNGLLVASPVAIRKTKSRSQKLAAANKREGISIGPETVEKLCERVRLRRDKMLIKQTFLFGYRWSESIAIPRAPIEALTCGEPGAYEMDRLEGAVHEDVRGRRYLGPPKSGGGRTTDIHAAFVGELLDYVDWLPSRHHYLYVQVRAGGLLNYDSWMRTIWRPLCDGDGLQAGVWPGLNFHDLKHGNIALMHDLGIHRVLHDHRVGHSAGNVSDEYNRPTPKMRKDCVDTFQRWSEEQSEKKISRNSPTPAISTSPRTHLRLASVDGRTVVPGERIAM